MVSILPDDSTPDLVAKPSLQYWSLAIDVGQGLSRACKSIDVPARVLPIGLEVPR
jgi:hypothetical protein